MSLPDFEAWAIFAKVVETGSFIRTAETLNLSQPTVSKAISRLEEQMKTTLFFRTSRKLTLTDSGLAVKKQAEQLLLAGLKLEAQLKEEVNQYQGVVKFAVPLSFGLQQIAPLLGEFCETYPDIDLDIHLADEQVDLVDERFDFALRIARLEDSSFRVKRLCGVALLIVASPNFLEKRPLVHPKDLHNVPAFIYTNQKNPQSWTFFHPTQGEFTQTMKGNLRANNADVFLPALQEGLGVAILPEFMVCNQIRESKLAVVFDDWQISPVSLYLLAPPNPLRPKRVQVLMDFLSEKLRGMIWAKD